MKLFWVTYIDPIFGYTILATNLLLQFPNAIPCFRYYAITKPLEYGVKRTPKRMIIWVILVWCFAACISLPPLLIIGNEHSEKEENGVVNNDVCLVAQDFGYQVYATLCSFYIPLTVMMVVYYKIFRAARKIVMEEKRAQSHLESHCYLEISVKNGEVLRE